MPAFTRTIAVRVVTLDALKALLPELVWLNPGDLTEAGPYVYVHVDADGAVHYPGKSDAKNAAVAKRALDYPRWSGRYKEELAATQLPDVVHDLHGGSVDVLTFSPIVRYFTFNNLTVKVASVAQTGESGAVWEARIKALSAALTGLESVVGGSGWERKPGLRGDAYDWGDQRLIDYQNGAIASA